MATNKDYRDSVTLNQVYQQQHTAQPIATSSGSSGGDGGEQRAQDKTTTIKAASWKTRLEQAHARGGWQELKEERASINTLAELVREFIRTKQKERRSKATIKWHEEALAKFLTFSGSDTLIADLTDKRLVTYYSDYLCEQEKPQLQIISINTYLRSFRAFRNWAIEQEYIGRECRENKVKLLEDNPNLHHARQQGIISPAEFTWLLEVARRDESSELLQLRGVAILLLLYHTGLRASELCQARWPNISAEVVDGQEAHLLKIQGAKGGDERVLVLLEPTWKAIKEYREGLAGLHGRSYASRGANPIWLFVSHKDIEQPLTVNALQSFCQRVSRYPAEVDQAEAEPAAQAGAGQAQKAKIKGVKANPHRFRHTCATNLTSAGCTSQFVQWFLGWTSAKMVGRYSHPQNEALIRAARKFGSQ